MGIAPVLSLVFTLYVSIAPILNIGNTYEGESRFIPITGGNFSGPRLNGEVLPYGGDLQFEGADGVTRANARYFIRIDDGTVVSVTNAGLIRQGPDGLSAKTVPEFKVATGKYDWLNKSVFIADLVASDDPGVVTLNVFEVLWSTEN